MLFERATCHISLFKKGATASQEEGGPGFGRRERNVFLGEQAFCFGFEWFICFLHRVSCKKSAVFAGKLCFFPGKFGDFAFTRSLGRTRGAVAWRWLRRARRGHGWRGSGGTGRTGVVADGHGFRLLSEKRRDPGGLAVATEGKTRARVVRLRRYRLGRGCGGYSFFFRNEGSARADGRGVFPLAMARSFLVITRYLKESEGLVERRGSWSMGNFSLRLSL